MRCYRVYNATLGEFVTRYNSGRRGPVWWHRGWAEKKARQLAKKGFRCQVHVYELECTAVLDV